MSAIPFQPSRRLEHHLRVARRRSSGALRLEGKVAIVTGAGQTPGETIGNGRATAVLLAREGSRVLLVDRNGDGARETREMIAAKGGESVDMIADVRSSDDCDAMVKRCVEKWSRVDILVNNVGVGAAGDSGPVDLEEDEWHRIIDTNLTTMFLTCKHVLPVMREQHAGSIVNISSIASIVSTPMLAYKVSKAGVNALTQQVAAGNARHGIRCNAILPGLMDTPMAVDAVARRMGIPREQAARVRDEMVPMGKMGTAWDVAYAALYLASDEARFVTGALLPVDGGQSVRQS
jgi:NAD(P)-dependent dehydrogenase (short-subunit alcohol dehydrogenase family)